MIRIPDGAVLPALILGTLGAVAETLPSTYARLGAGIVLFAGFALAVTLRSRRARRKTLAALEAERSAVVEAEQACQLLEAKVGELNDSTTALAEAIGLLKAEVA